MASSHPYVKHPVVLICDSRPSPVRRWVCYPGNLTVSNEFLLSNCINNDGTVSIAWGREDVKWLDKYSIWE